MLRNQEKRVFEGGFCKMERLSWLWRSECQNVLLGPISLALSLSLGVTLAFLGSWNSNAMTSRISGTGKGKPARNLGSSTLPWTLTQPSVRGVPKGPKNQKNLEISRFPCFFLSKIARVGGSRVCNHRKEWVGPKSSQRAKGKSPEEVILARFSAIHLWGRLGRGHCREISANFHEISANFPQNSRTLPDPPILCFFRFPCFFCFPIFLAFSCVFPSFSKDFRGSAKRETLAFLGKNPCFFEKKGGVGGSGFRARTKLSSAPPTAAPFLWGNRDVEIEIFERDLKKFDRDWKARARLKSFWSLGPLGFFWNRQFQPSSVFLWLLVDSSWSFVATSLALSFSVTGRDWSGEKGTRGAPPALSALDSLAKGNVEQNVRTMSKKKKSDKCPKLSGGWSAANGGLRDGSLRKSEDIRGKVPPFSGFPRCSSHPPEKGEKGWKRAILADFQEGRPDTP